MSEGHGGGVRKSRVKMGLALWDSLSHKGGLSLRHKCAKPQELGSTLRRLFWGLELKPPPEKMCVYLNTRVVLRQH